MRLTATQRVDRDEYVYTLTISGGELSTARLDRFDRWLLADCQSPDATIADSLLALELLARRIEASQVAA